MSADTFGPAIVRPWYIEERVRACKRHRAARVRPRHRAAHMRDRAGVGAVLGAVQARQLGGRA